MACVAMSGAASRMNVPSSLSLPSRNLPAPLGLPSLRHGLRVYRQHSREKQRTALAARAAAGVSLASLVLEAPASAAVETVTPQSPSFFSDLVESTQSAISDAVEAVSDATESVVDSATDFATSARESALDVVDTVRESGQDLLEKATATSALVANPGAENALDEAAPAAAEAPQVPDFGGADVSSFDLPAEGPAGAIDSSDFLPPPEDVLPRLRGPRFQFNLPEVKTPEFNLPKFEKPEFSLPKFQLPKFELPELKKPDFSLPEVNLPELKAPELSLPSLTKPESFKLPEVTAPELSLPDYIKSRLPELPKLPELPGLQAPSLSEIKERVPLPKLSIPPQLTQPIKDAAASTAAAAQDKASLASSFLLEKAVELYEQLKLQVPEEYAPLVGKVETNLESFWGVASGLTKEVSEKLAVLSFDLLRSTFGAAGYEVDDSIITFTLIVLGTTVASVFYYRAVYGGYSGDLSPEESLKLLKETNAVLLDLRPEALRLEDGIPDLRRGARFKDRYLEFQKYTGPVRGQLRNPNSVDLQLFSATLRGLKGVSGSTSVVVMDDSGSSEAKDIARALAKYGFERSYLLSGGFKGWVSDGFSVKPDEPEPLADILKNEFEAFIEEVKPTPEQVVNFAVVTAVAGYALYEWERSFQILGGLLVAQIIYNRAKTYESASDFQRDLRIVSAPFVFTATVLGWVLQVAGLGPSKASPELATVSDGVSATTGEGETWAALPGSSAEAPAEAEAEAATEAAGAQQGTAETDAGREEVVPIPETNEEESRGGGSEEAAPVLAQQTEESKDPSNGTLSDSQSKPAIEPEPTPSGTTNA